MPADSAAFHVSEGNRLRDERKLEEAARAFFSALQREPDHLEALINGAITLQELGRLPEAEVCYRKAVAVAPSSAEPLRHLAFYLHETGRLLEALPIYRQVLVLEPEWGEGYANIGHILQLQGPEYVKQALVVYNMALRHGSSHPAVYVNIGAALSEFGRLDQAMEAFSKALALDPNCASAKYNMARLFLRQGRWDEGWPGHEFRPPRAVCTRSEWRGEPFPGKTLLLRAEQGLGDNICWARYAALVKERSAGGTVMIEAAKPLRRLMERCRGVDRVVANPQEIDSIDLEIPLPTLPSIFKTTLETIPQIIPYFQVDPWTPAEIEQRLGKKRGPRIGLIWESGPVQPQRSCPPELFFDLAKENALSFYSLQAGPSAEALKRSPFAAQIPDLGTTFTDLYDCAQAMLAMDLIITVDTGPAHLACALGRPTWLLLIPQPHWLYLLDRSDSPWYPTATLFRQKNVGDWTGPLREIGARLKTFSPA